MIRRTQKLSKQNSFFLFGARGAGKTTLIKDLFEASDTLWIDLLAYEEEDRYSRRPGELAQQLDTGRYRRVVIDEVQKAPKLLDAVHKLMQERPEIQFVMTGSSARKLKRGSANLLAGRAFTYSLFPLTHVELGRDFSLDEALAYGTLPKVGQLADASDKEQFLRAYIQTYLREEILIEQLARNIDPFRDFLEVAAQSNGKIVNYAKISRDIGVDDKTVKSYFDILADTLVGFYLPAFHRSVRKQQRVAPKFYLFDPGARRALDGSLRIPLKEGTYEYGRTFEHFVVCECTRFNEYMNLDYKMSYFRTKDSAEVDLVILRPGQPDLLVEIKSSDRIDPVSSRKLGRILQAWDQEAKGHIWSLDTKAKVMNGIECYHWKEGLAKAGFTNLESL